MKIQEELLSELWQEARAVAPLECCGVLWSSVSGEVVDQRTSYPGPLFRDRFKFRDEWWLQVLKDGRKEGLCFAGVYHSHPHLDLTPSQRDIEGHPEGCFGLLLGTEPDLVRLYRYHRASFQEYSLQIQRS